MNKKVYAIGRKLKQRAKAGIGCKDTASFESMAEVSMYQVLVGRPFESFICDLCGMIHVLRDDRYVEVEREQSDGRDNQGARAVASSVNRDNSKAAKANNRT